MPFTFTFCHSLGIVWPGSRFQLWFHITHLDSLAIGFSGLVLYEPVSSQIDWIVGLETTGFENLACNFTDGLVPRIHQAVLSQSRSCLFQSKDPYADVRTLLAEQTRIPSSDGWGQGPGRALFPSGPAPAHSFALTCPGLQGFAKSISSVPICITRCKMSWLLVIWASFGSVCFRIKL